MLIIGERKILRALRNSKVKGLDIIPFRKGNIIGEVRIEPYEDIIGITVSIKNKLSLVVFLTGFNNPEFDAQTKESLSNSPSHIAKHLNGQIDFDNFVKVILKNDNIINPIIETFKIKEDAKWTDGTDLTSYDFKFGLINKLCIGCIV